MSADGRQRGRVRQIPQWAGLTLCEVNPDHATDVAGQFARLVSLLRDAVWRLSRRPQEGRLAVQVADERVARNVWVAMKRRNFEKSGSRLGLDPEATLRRRGTTFRGPEAAVRPGLS